MKRSPNKTKKKEGYFLKLIALSLAIFLVMMKKYVW